MKTLFEEIRVLYLEIGIGSKNEFGQINTQQTICQVMEKT
jgi:hypothetical protein